MAKVYVPSGAFGAPTRTPTGAAFQYAVDNPYVTKDDLLNSPYAMGLGITASDARYANGVLDAYIKSASGMINRYANRYFDVQTIDEQMTRKRIRPYNVEPIRVTLKNYPFWSINTIYIQILRFFVGVSLDYLQVMPTFGEYAIVPLLTAGGGAAAFPIPAYLLAHPLTIVWTNYTFGYGQVITGQSCTNNAGASATTQNKLLAPSQTITIYRNGTAMSPTLYTIDYANGVITFTPAIGSSDTVTADFTTNEGVPQEIREATMALTAYLLSLQQNPMGADSFSVMNFNLSVQNHKENHLVTLARSMVEPYKSRRFQFV